MRFAFADLKRRVIGIEFRRGIDLELNRAVVRQAAQVGEIGGRRFGGKGLVEPDLEFGMTGRVPMDQLALNLADRGIDDVKRLRDNAARETDQTAPHLKDLAARHAGDIGIGEGGEGQVAVDVGPEGSGNEKQERARAKGFPGDKGEVGHMVGKTGLGFKLAVQFIAVKTDGGFV